MHNLAKVDRSVYNAVVSFPASSTANLAAMPARERILVTAHDLFYREGIRSTGIDTVIERARVTKVTFYRHFKSKNELILAYLEYRHERWMRWFTAALQRHGATLKALVPAMAEWFRSPEYRGCAFINGVSEIAPALPQVTEITRRHKADMQKAIAALLPPGRQRESLARSLALAVDGSIVQAQFRADPAGVLKDLRQLVRLIAGSRARAQSSL
jgi:AcrR family transcriptional regulator